MSKCHNCFAHLVIVQKMLKGVAEFDQSDGEENLMVNFLNSEVAACL